MADKQPNLNNVPESLHSVLIEGYNLNFSKALNRGIELFRQEAVNLLIFSIGFWALAFLANNFSEELNDAMQGVAGDPEMTFAVIQEKMPQFGGFMLLISLLQVPLTAGFYVYLRKVTLGEERSFNDLLGGFRYFVPLILTTLLMSVLIALSLITIFGVIYLAVAYGFATLFVVLFDLKPWESMESSRKIIHKKWWDFFGLFFVLGIISFALGLIPFQVGTLIAAPLVACVTYAAFEDIIFVQHGSGYDSRIDEIGSNDDF